MSTPTTPLTDAAVAELRKLMEAASPGKWFVGTGSDDDERAGVVLIRSDVRRHAIPSWLFQTSSENGRNNAHAVCAAVNALPSLLEERDRLREALKDMILTYESAARCVVDRKTGQRLIEVDAKHIAAARAALNPA